MYEVEQCNLKLEVLRTLRIRSTIASNYLFKAPLIRVRVPLKLLSFNIFPQTQALI